MGPLRASPAQPAACAWPEPGVQLHLSSLENRAAPWGLYPRRAARDTSAQSSSGKRTCPNKPAVSWTRSKTASSPPVHGRCVQTPERPRLDFTRAPSSVPAPSCPGGGGLSGQRSEGDEQGLLSRPKADRGPRPGPQRPRTETLCPVGTTRASGPTSRAPLATWSCRSWAPQAFLSEPRNKCISPMLTWRNLQTFW